MRIEQWLTALAAALCGICSRQGPAVGEWQGAHTLLRSDSQQRRRTSIADHLFPHQRQILPRIVSLAASRTGKPSPTHWPQSTRRRLQSSRILSAGRQYRLALNEKRHLLLPGVST